MQESEINLPLTDSRKLNALQDSPEFQFPAGSVIFRELHYKFSLSFLVADSRSLQLALTIFVDVEN